MQNFKRILSICIRKFKIGTRLFLFQTFIIVTIFLCAIFWTYLSISQISNQYIYEHLQSEQKIIADNLSMHLEEIAMLSLRYKNNSDFYTIAENETLDHTTKESAFKNAASSVQSLSSDSIASAYLIDSQEQVYFLNGDSSLPFPNPKTAAHSHNSSYFHIGKLFSDANGKYYIPVSIRFYNFYTFQEIGSLVLYIPHESIAQIFDSQRQDTYITFLTDANGNILSHNNSTYIGKSVENLNMKVFTTFSSVHKTSFNEEDYFISTVPLNRASNTIGFSWKLITLTPCDILYSTLNQLQHLLILFALLVIPLSFLLSLYLSSRMTLPLKRLSTKLRTLSEQTLNSFLAQNPKDELWDLEQGYNEMLLKINDLLEKNKQEQIKKRELEFTALQAQINPHFLYNTLDTISWIAALKDQPEIEQMVLELSRFFRLGLHSGDVFISLEDELKIVSSYLTVEQLRNPGKFDVVYEVVPELLKIKVPKFILQPIVENAVKHGISEIPHQGIITIRGYFIENDIYLEVSDNGLGIQNKKPRLKGSGYGLKNIAERIQLEYGANYGLHIDSRDNEGTTVQVHIHF